MSLILIESYTARHKRVARVRGRAADHPCTHCDKPARDWATVKGRTGVDPLDYIPLCRKCHLVYDDLIGKRKPVEWTPEMREERSRRTKRQWDDPEYRAKRVKPLARPETGPHNRVKESCPQGHPYVTDNVYVGRRSDGTTFRRCKVCHNEKAKARRCQPGKDTGQAHPR